MALPAAAYLSNSARTVAEMKTAMEDQRDAIAQLPGATARTELTISGGAIVPPDGSGGGVHTVDTEGSAATDDLTSITTTNCWDGMLIRLSAENTARVVTLKHGTGNLSLAHSLDVELTDLETWVEFQLRGTTWVETQRHFPACLVNAYLTADQTLSDATETTLAGWTEAYDTLGAFNATTGVFTAPANGLYSFSWSAELVVDAGNATEAFRTVLTDGSGGDRAYGVGWNNTTSVSNLYSVGAAMLSLTMGSPVLFRALHSTGANRDVKGGASGARFSVKREW